MRWAAMASKTLSYMGFLSADPAGHPSAHAGGTGSGVVTRGGECFLDGSYEPGADRATAGGAGLVDTGLQRLRQTQRHPRLGGVLRLGRSRWWRRLRWSCRRELLGRHLLGDHPLGRPATKAHAHHRAVEAGRAVMRRVGGELGPA